MFKLDRRWALAGALSAAALLLAACNGGGGGAAAPAAGEMSMGAEDAPVTVVEYASITCPHCADWNERVWPQFKARYVDTGLVRYVFREFPTPPANIAVAGFLLARCAGPDRYFPMIDSMFRNQRAIVTNPRQELLRLARTAGMSEEAFDACVTNQGSAEALNGRVDDAIAAGVQGTPSFFVNGELIASTSVPLETLAEAIDPLLGDRAPPPLPAAGDAPAEG